jgi:phage tail sheath protein FI
MPNYLSPDIYVEEISTGPRPIGAVGTSTAAFLGLAPKGDAYSGDPRAVNNWSEFLREFAPPNPKDTSTDLSHAVFGFFQNGGSRCIVVNLGKEMTLGDGLATLEALDEIAIVAAPGYADAASYEALISHCEKLKDRVAILDPPKEPVKIEALTRVAEPKPARGDGGGRGAAAGGAGPGPGYRPRQSDPGMAAFYHPRIKVLDPLSSKVDPVPVPPSGHIAGIWARTDSTRGVHKAPANEPIRGALDVTYRITRSEQEVLNPAGVNCIRWFPTEGIRVWGARTIAAEASEWRYLNVRRLFNMIEESIARGTRWVVFEPNDRPLWQDIKRDVGAFLRTLWRDGALMGRSPEEAFFVQCDEETNPPDSIDQGRVVIVIGIAPVKPAEFIIFRIGQHSGGVEIEA